MDYTPIPEFDGYFMQDAVGVFKKRNDKYVYVKPHPRKGARDFYVNLVKDGKHVIRSLKSLAWATFQAPATPMGTSRGIPDFPSYSFYEEGAVVKVFKNGKPMTIRKSPNRKEPYYVLTDYAGVRKLVSMTTIHIMFVNSFDPNLAPAPVS